MRDIVQHGCKAEIVHVILHHVHVILHHTTTHFIHLQQIHLYILDHILHAALLKYI